jgi:hypothetical protein
VFALGRDDRAIDDGGVGERVAPLPGAASPVGAFAT